MRAEKNVHLDIASTVLAFEQVEVRPGGRQIEPGTSRFQSLNRVNTKQYFIRLYDTCASS